MTRRNKSTQHVAVFGGTLVLAVALLASCEVAWGQQDQMTEPVYRVAGEAPANQAAAAPAVVAAAPQGPFNLTQRPGEHPLMPLIRVAEASLAQIDQNVRDYSCTFVKQERIDGQLGEPQHIFMKVLHQPFSVYMSFIQPFPGREVAYVDGQNDNEIAVLECGWKRKLGVMHLDPQGMVAMRGQKYPITRVGIRNLTAEIIQNSKADTQYGECDVTTQPNVKIAGRPTTLVQINHPVPRQNFRAHIARIFFDNELRVPIHYDAYLWPEQPGGERPLDESYTYLNLKFNNGFTAADFDSENNPQIFQ